MVVVLYLCEGMIIENLLRSCKIMFRLVSRPLHATRHFGFVASTSQPSQILDFLRPLHDTRHFLRTTETRNILGVPLEFSNSHLRQPMAVIYVGLGPKLNCNNNVVVEMKSTTTLLEYKIISLLEF